MKRLMRFQPLWVFLALFLVASCGSSSQTVVVNDAPVAQADTTRRAGPASSNFTKLAIGENEAIHSLDPLFAETGAELRAIQLVYEGLVRFNNEGEAVPAAASRWTVNADSSRFTFTLRPDLYFHDSNVFGNGRGRKVTATDVKRNFERMAQLQVPPHAARLFMNIAGFEPYFQEQHHVFQPSKRTLDGVSGIQAPNDSTVVFKLAASDFRFLNKLATPLAVLYPQEAASASRFQAVGTGPFQLSQQRADSLFIFARFDNYYAPDMIPLNRIDVITSGAEQPLLQAFSNDAVQLLPEMGPRQMRALLTDAGQLTNQWMSQAQLGAPQSIEYSLDYHSGDVSQNSVSAALQQVKSAPFFSELPSGVASLRWSLPQNRTTAAADSIAAVRTESPFASAFLATLSEQLAANGTSLQRSQYFVPNRTTALVMQRQSPWAAYMPDMNEQNQARLASLTVQMQALISPAVQGYSVLPGKSWWINPRSISIAQEEGR